MERRRPQHEPTTLEPGPRLPAWKAFVVQFTAESDGAGRILAGRVEHLSSGARLRFASGAELLACLQRLLREAHE